MTKIYLKHLFVTLFILMPFIQQAQWVQRADIVQGKPGRGAAFSFALNGKLYVAGGYVGFTDGHMNDMQMYDPAQNKWSNKTFILGSLNRSAGTSFVINGKAYAGLGSQGFLSFPSIMLTDFYEYNESGDSWIVRASFPDTGRTQMATFVVNNKAYIVGGDKGSTGTTSEVWEYNPPLDKWTKMNDYPMPIENAVGFSNGTRAFVTGGVTTGGTVVAKTYEYIPSSDSWVPRADNLVGPTQAGVAFMINGDAYYGLGASMQLGSAGNVHQQSFYKYIIAQDKWEAVTGGTGTFPKAGRMWGIAQTINNKAYVGMGYKYQSGEFAYKDLFEATFTPLSTSTLTRNDIDIYPNPATNRIQLTTSVNQESFNYTLQNVIGQTSLSGTIQSGDFISVDGLSKGAYFLRLSNKEGQLTRQIQIQ